MADVFELRLQIMRDGETWYVVGAPHERHEIGSTRQLMDALHPFLYGLALSNVEIDGKRITAAEWFG